MSADERAKIAVVGARTLTKQCLIVPAGPLYQPRVQEEEGAESS